jgi:hypothetical protein
VYVGDEIPKEVAELGIAQVLGSKAVTGSRVYRKDSKWPCRLPSRDDDAGEGAFIWRERDLSPPSWSALATARHTVSARARASPPRAPETGPWGSAYRGLEYRPLRRSGGFSRGGVENRLPANATANIARCQEAPWGFGKGTVEEDAGIRKAGKGNRVKVRV